MPQLTQKQSDRLPGHYGGRTENRHSPPGLQGWALGGSEAPGLGALCSHPGEGGVEGEGVGWGGRAGGVGGQGGGWRTEEEGKEEK